MLDSEFIPATEKLVADALAPLVGVALSGLWQPAYQVFEFGPQTPEVNHHGEPITLSEWNLCVSCDWHVSEGDIVILGAADLDEKPSGHRFYDRTTPPRDAEQRQRWRNAQRFFDYVDKAMLTVQTVIAGPAGSITLELSRGFAIRTFQNSSRQWEFWHLVNRIENTSLYLERGERGLVCWSAQSAPQVGSPP